MTQMSKSKTRSVAAIGNSGVILAQAEIQWCASCVIPANAGSHVGRHMKVDSRERENDRVVVLRASGI